MRLVKQRAVVHELKQAVALVPVLAALVGAARLVRKVGVRAEAHNEAIAHTHLAKWYSHLAQVAEDETVAVSAVATTDGVYPARVERAHRYAADSAGEVRRYDNRAGLREQVLGEHQHVLLVLCVA